MMSLSGACMSAQRLVPIAHCVEVSPEPPPAGRNFPVFIAHFGYQLSGSANVSIRPGSTTAGAANYVFPASATPYGIPGVFRPGYRPFVFGAVGNAIQNPYGSEEYPEAERDTLTWSLGGSTASASIGPGNTIPATKAALPICPVMAFAPSSLKASTPGPRRRITVAIIKGDYSYNLPTVTDVRIVNGNGAITLQNPKFTPSSFRYFSGGDPYGSTFGGYLAGTLAGDLTYTGATATTATLQFTLSAEGLDPQVFSLPVTYSPDGDNCATNVSGQTMVTLSGLSQNIMTRVWTQTARVENSSDRVLAGPIRLALDSLSANAVLTNATGTTSCAGPASPYLVLNGDLAPGQTAVFSLSFTNSAQGQAITFTPRVLSGGTQQ